MNTLHSAVVTTTRYQMQSPVGPRVTINDRERDYFAGCSYLGLQDHPALIAAAADALARYGLGTATSRGGYGEHPVYTAVEAAAARYFGTEAALYYVSAYLGNTILLQGLAGDYDRIFVDAAAHFSVWDAVRAARVPAVAFGHGDAADLARQLRDQLRPGERPLVISDGVFPVSGEIAPVPEYVAVLAEYPAAILCLDDAHATGVLGAGGRGTAEYWQEVSLGGFDSSRAQGVCDPRQPVADRPEAHNSAPGSLRVYSAHTLSKALGCHGGVIAGDAALIARLRRDAAAFGATSPSPLPAAAAAAAALDLVAGQSPLRAQLWTNVAQARSGLRGLGWSLADTPVPVLCLHARPGLDLARIQAELFERDICVAHVTRYSSTPPGGALRVAIFATHTAAQIERLIAAVGELA